MKILFTTPVLEYPFVSGPTLRIGNTIKALNRVAELHIVSRVSKEKINGITAEDYFKSNSHSFSYIASSAPKGSYSFTRKVLKKTQPSLDKFFEKRRNLKKDINYLSDYIKYHQIDIVWFGFGNISYEIMKALKDRFPQIKMVCDTDSVWSRFILRELDSLKDDKRKKEIIKLGKLKEQEEERWCSFMDITTAVSDVDASYYQTISQKPTNVKLFSNVIDLEDYIVKHDPPVKFKKPCIYLAGTFWKDSPMEYAANWLINDILPIVRKSIPNIHLYIVGNGSNTILNNIKDDGITIAGKCPSVLPYLQNADIALVPLKFESGTRFKILEAGACGIPLVSTTLGAEGIPVKDEEHILLADDTQSFAQAIIRLLEDQHLANKLAHNCRNLIRQNYSIDTLESEALSIIDYLTQHHD